MSNTDLSTLTAELERLKAEVAELREAVGRSKEKTHVETRLLPDGREFTAPPEMHEWANLLRSYRTNPEDMVIAIGGLLECPNDFRVWKTISSQSEWLNQSTAEVAMAISHLAHEARWELMKALFLSERSAGELQEMTGLVGGQFYHHMKELALGGYIAQKERGRYMLSSKGMLMFATLMCLIHALSEITHQAEEKLVEPGDIS